MSNYLASNFQGKDGHMISKNITCTIHAICIYFMASVCEMGNFWTYQKTHKAHKVHKVQIDWSK